MSSYFVDKQPNPNYAGYEIKFDYSAIRPKGSYISGGYKAPGPDGLKASLEKNRIFIRKLVKKQKEINYAQLLFFDILCLTADAVLSGGIRRAALNMIVDPYDEEMIMAKTGNWFIDNPHRARSNNSVLMIRDLTTKEDFERIVNLNNGSSDIGFAFANSWFDMFNPLFYRRHGNFNSFWI